MVTDFEERLRQIREAKSRESAEQQRQSEEQSLERHLELENRFDRREQIEKAIEQYGDKFMEVVPAFARSKSFFEGMYKIEVSNDEVFVGDQGKVTKLFSRVTFLIDTQSPDGRIVVRCKKTVRNRDLESTMCRIERTPEALDEFRQFAEQQFFDFASSFFSGRASASTH